MRRVFPFVLALTLTLAACGGRHVNADAVTAYRQAEAQKVLHDFTAGVVTLNHEKKIPDDLELTLLRIDQQISDVIHDKPTGWLDAAESIVRNGVQALSPEAQAQVKGLFEGLLNKLASVMNGGA